MNALQTYIRELRIGKGLSQDALAGEIGLSRRAFINWEAGRTEGIKEGPLFKAVDILGAALHHVYYLTRYDVSVEQAANIAKKWRSGEDLIPEADILEIADSIKAQGKVREVLQVIQKLQGDPSALDRLIGYSQSLLDQNR